VYYIPLLSIVEEKNAFFRYPAKYLIVNGNFSISCGDLARYSQKGTPSLQQVF
jgi:hypothetical protein